MPKADRTELLANIMKSFRLLTSAEGNVEAIQSEYPEFLKKLSDHILANSRNSIIKNEATQIIRNFRRQHVGIPEQLSDFVANLTGSSTEMTFPKQIESTQR